MCILFRDISRRWFDVTKVVSKRISSAFNFESYLINDLTAQIVTSVGIFLGATAKLRPLDNNNIT